MTPVYADCSREVISSCHSGRLMICDVSFIDASRAIARDFSDDR
jgi:hypothetical protein